MNPNATAAPASRGGDEVDLNALFFRLRRRWPLFLGGLALSLALAAAYLQTKAPLYSFRATMLLGDEGANSRRAQQLLRMLDASEKGPTMEDEVGRLSAANTMRQAVGCLPYAVSYYAAPGSWLNRLQPLQVRQQAAADVPFRVEVNLKAAQLAGVRVWVEPAGPGRYRVQAEAAQGQLVRLPQGELLRELGSLRLDETVAAGDTLRTPLLRLAIRPNPKQAFPPDGTRYFFTLSSLPEAAADYQDAVTVRPVDHESRIVELTMKAGVPQLATTFLDTLMAVYAANDLREKNLAGQKTVAFLDEKLAKLASSHRQKAEALASFRATRGVVDVGAQSTSGIQQLSALEATQSRLLTNRRYYQNLLRVLQANQGLDQALAPSSVGIESPGLDQRLLELHQLAAKRAELGVNASDINPLVQKTDESIRVARASLVQLLQNMSQAADVGLRDANAQLGTLRGQLNRLPDDERQLTALKGAADFDEKTYAFLEEKRSEAAIVLATNASDKHVLDKAQQVGSKPVAPRPLLVLLLAVLGGVGVPAAAAMLLDRTNRRIQRPEDLAQLTDIPVLGMVAHSPAQDAALREPKGLLAESFRSIRINLQYLAGGRDKKVIGITSSVPGEGKTFCALHLAAELARGHRRVVLLECDMRRPTLGSYFHSPQGPGLSALLDGRVPLERVLQHDIVPGLDVVCCGSLPANPTALLESAQMAALLERLRAEYDYIVLDTPPMGYVAEFFVLLRYFDASLYIVRQNYTDKPLLTQIDELHRAQKVRDLYLVLNDVEFAKTYGYGYKASAYAYGQ